MSSFVFGRGIIPKARHNQAPHAAKTRKRSACGASCARITGSAALMGVAVTAAGLLMDGIVFLAAAAVGGVVLYFGMPYVWGEIK